MAKDTQPAQLTGSFVKDDMLKVNVGGTIRKFPEPVITNNVNCYEKVMALTKTSVLYGRGGSGWTLRKSTDWGVTWSTAYTFGTGPAIIKQVLVTDSGRIVVALDNGTAWTSDTNGANFTQTLTMAANTFVHDLFGATVYGDIVAFAEYSATKTPATATGAWYSEDAGQTWTNFFRDTTHTTGFHLHDIKYDPYEDMFWITSGDGDGNRMVFYSKNRGATWYQAQIFQIPVQATSIIPLPECVLFVSDSPTVCVQRYNRPEGGTQNNSKLTLEIALPIAENWVNEVPIGTMPLITYGADAAAYFGWSMAAAAKPGGNELKYSPAYATRDGREFFIIYRSNKAAQNEGFYGAYGPDDNGNIVIVSQDRNLGAQTCNNIVMNTKMWKTR